MVTRLTHEDVVTGRGGWGGELAEQNALERGGAEGCFVFTNWLLGAFDYDIKRSNI